MKTTVEIDDELLKAAKKRAIDDGMTLRELLEQALRSRLADPAHPSIYGAFSTRGELYDEASWPILEQIREAYARLEKREAAPPERHS